MNAHEKSSDESRKLCNLLLSSVQESLPGVKRNEAQEWCSLGITTRFAYSHHRRHGVRVYLYEKVPDGQQLNALADQSGQILLEQRRTMESAWAKLTPYFLDLDSEEEIRAAIPLILHAANKVKARLNPHFLLPSEESASEMMEGNRIKVQVSHFERDRKAREKCIQIFGHCCFVCGFDFERTYGEIGSGFIHVHHLNPIAEAKGRRPVNPKTDLRPVCPNCHEMLHKKAPPFSIDELKARISIREA